LANNITKQKVEKKAFDVIDDLLSSDDEKIKMQAVKFWQSISGKKAVKEIDKSLLKKMYELLISDDEKTLLQSVMFYFTETRGKEGKNGVKIVSPYEKWYKKNRRKKDFNESDFKYHWFDVADYSPHEPQKLIHGSDKRFVVCISGRRLGKSLLASKEAEAVLMQPNKRVWIVAPTYNLTDMVFREIYKTLVIDRKVKLKAIIKKSESERLIKLAWGSEVVGKSADNPDSLVGEAVDFLIFDECAKTKRRIWEKCLRPTLTDRQGRALFITTPEGTNWVYRLYLRGLKKKSKEWDAFLFPTEKNPYISKDDLLEAKRTLAPEVFNQEYMADFFSFSGKVYKDFLAQIHVTGITFDPR
jgi:hypothetical protein